ncbi:hypothetical protein H0E84_03615 [Luteimonas sp. SJ-92]|uniref:Uncharacterized protein n=1 Tax=Luteimonas salinisoli TaxID=2752307 RepID=A0A853J9Z9_9GAMM|nr:hypothetical protein [Luteimonas salinisoli]NZA25460.1 hypothetical protein [Luteimonas salinisoli]
MSAPATVETTQSQSSHRRKWRWIALAGAACLLSWVALAVGIALGVGTAAMFVLATLAAVTTEGTVWLAALLLGVSVYQARRRLWETLRSRLR